ncbi:DUF2787 domain-containing protein [Proteus mirabilis]|uniref:DUF2787 family protein n=1 Tax=Proteus mirabilis TaxID=584 RepID=UPI0012B49844|nr:DUF2787 family protein [Proteus mirabilis]EJD6408928.1 DUF2787 family protein [Providencia rettgeri]QGM66302.1 DUF2787 domain-containing protein [Proteus mirabilis]QGM73262.1 DUF2787 domain-containing protein [Proteus mirabilis]HCB3591432.1 DUF2787 family protein [Proteus mirabilis]HCB3827857.1 DUF2787 family protein [Proteus mirabilis]
MTIHQSRLRLPIAQAFSQLLLHELNNSVINSAIDLTTVRAVTLNFRDPLYSAETGGFHPVEIRLLRLHEQWLFDYVTDFSFMGNYYPELEKELDICWSQGYIYHFLMGDIDEEEGGALFELWQRNFIQYHKMKCYEVSIQWETH